MHDSGRACGCMGELAVRMGLGLSWGYIGDVHEAAGRVVAAHEAYTASHRIRQKLFEDFKDDPNSAAQLTIQLARSFGNLALLRPTSGRTDCGGHPGGEGDRTPRQPAQEIPRRARASERLGGPGL